MSLESDSTSPSRETVDTKCLTALPPMTASHVMHTLDVYPLDESKKEAVSEPPHDSTRRAHAARTHYSKFKAAKQAPRHFAGTVPPPLRPTMQCTATSSTAVTLKEQPYRRTDEEVQSLVREEMVRQVRCLLEQRMESRLEQARLSEQLKNLSSYVSHAVAHEAHPIQPILASSRKPLPHPESKAHIRTPEVSLSVGALQSPAQTFPAAVRAMPATSPRRVTVSSPCTVRPFESNSVGLAVTQTTEESEAPSDHSAVELVRVVRLKGIPDHNRGLYAGLSQRTFTTRSGQFTIGIPLNYGSRIRSAASYVMWLDQERRRQFLDGAYTPDGMSGSGAIAVHALRAAPRHSRTDAVRHPLRLSMKSFGDAERIYFQWVQEEGEGGTPKDGEENAEMAGGTSVAPLGEALTQALMKQYGKPLTQKQREDAKELLRRRREHRNSLKKTENEGNVGRGRGSDGGTDALAMSILSDDANMDNDPFAVKGPLRALLSRHVSDASKRGSLGAADTTIYSTRSGNTGSLMSSKRISYANSPIPVQEEGENDRVGRGSLTQGMARPPRFKTLEGGGGERGLQTTSFRDTSFSSLDHTITVAESAVQRQANTRHAKQALWSADSSRGKQSRRSGSGSAGSGDRLGTLGGTRRISDTGSVSERGGRRVSSARAQSDPFSSLAHSRKSLSATAVAYEKDEAPITAVLPASTTPETFEPNTDSPRTDGRSTPEMPFVESPFTDPKSPAASTMDGERPFSDTPLLSLRHVDDDTPVEVILRASGGLMSKEQEAKLERFLLHFPEEEQHVRLRIEAVNILSGLVDNVDEEDALGAGISLPSFLNSVNGFLNDDGTVSGANGIYGGDGRLLPRDVIDVDDDMARMNASPVKGFEINEEELLEKFRAEAEEENAELVDYRNELLEELENQRKLLNCFTNDVRYLSIGKVDSGLTAEQYAIELTKEVNSYAHANQLKLNRFLKEVNEDVEHASEGFLDRFGKERQPTRDVGCQVTDADLGYVDAAVRSTEVELEQLLLHEKSLYGAVRLATIAVANIMSFHASLELESTCRECFYFFDHPRTLWPCGHTFCERCLVGMYNWRGDLICAECGSLCDVGFTPNLSMEMVANFQSVNPTGRGSIYSDDESAGTIAQMNATSRHGGLMMPSVQSGGDGQTIEAVLRGLLNDLLATQRNMNPMPPVTTSSSS